MNGSACPWSPLNPCEYEDRKSTRLNSSHLVISYAVFCLKKKDSPGLCMDRHNRVPDCRFGLQDLVLLCLWLRNLWSRCGVLQHREWCLRLIVPLQLPDL